MPTTVKKKPSTKTRVQSIERRKTPKKRKHRTWGWWILFILPIVLSIWLFAAPFYQEAQKVIPKEIILRRAERNVPNTVNERREVVRSRRSTASVEEIPEDVGLSENTKEDIDWVMNHMYKLLPLIISLIALRKKGVIMGRSK